MLQIIIGKAPYNGSPVTACYNVTIEDESLSFEELSDKILEGLKSSIDLFIDPTVIDFMSTSPISSLMDLKCLISTLAEQDIELIVTSVGANVIEGVGIMVKVTAPINDEMGIGVASDFMFTDRINMAEVASSIKDKYGLFNPSIFIDSPIDRIISQLDDTESNGIPDSTMTNALVEILTDLGFNIKFIYFNED